MASVFKTVEGQRQVLERYERILDRWPMPNRRHRLATRHGETFAVESGPSAAPVLILLHGTAANAASWIVDAPAWSERFRVICIDIPGDAGLSAQVRLPLGTDAHAEWLDDTLASLQVPTASFIGVSLGGYLALDYATRRPERVDSLVLMNAGGVGRHRNILIWALPLLMLGPWGRRKMLERIGGPIPKVLPPEAQAVLDLSAMIFQHFKPRTEALPQISDLALRRLAMPVFAILGGKDVFVDNQGTKARLEASVPKLKMRYLPEGRHFVPDQSDEIVGFLRRELDGHARR
jgi:pimeloyl-ACP methyl ester carboxylesterase